MNAALKRIMRTLRRGEAITPDDCDLLEEHLLGSYEAKFKAKLRLVARILVLERTLPNRDAAIDVALTEDGMPSLKRSTVVGLFNKARGNANLLRIARSMAEFSNDFK